MALYREDATGFITEWATNPGAGYTLLSNQPSDTLTNRVQWLRSVDTFGQSSTWHPSLPGGAEFPGVDSRSGSQVNIMPNDYSSFEWVGGMPTMYAQSATVVRTTTSYHRNYGLRITMSSSGGKVWLTPDGTTYNISIAPGKKWIVSWYAKPTTNATRTLTVTLKVADGTQYNVTGVTSSSSTTWQRSSAVFDLTASTQTSACIGVSVDSTNIAVDFDAIMLEEQVGPLTSPSSYYSPWANIDGRQIPDYTIDTAKFAQSIKPVEIVDVLPTVGNVEGRIVYLTTDNKLYRFDGTVWTAAVPAADITGQLTNDQLADIAASKIAGQITNTQISDNAISTPKLQAGAITTAKIAAGAVTAGEIAAGAITTAKLAVGAVTADQIAANAITSDKITANAITTAKIAAGAISTTELAAGAVAAGKLAANAIVAGDAVIATGAISSAQIGSLTADKIKTGTIGADTITLGSSSSIIQSANFASGSTGFRIRGTGDAEFYNVTVRGSLNAYDLTSGFLPTARLQDGSITDAKIGNLSANKITAGTMSAARISSGTISSGDIALNGGSAWIHSSNFVAGSSGWAISGAGNAEFYNCTVRGTLRAQDIVVGTLNTGQITNRAITNVYLVSSVLSGMGDWHYYNFYFTANSQIQIILLANANDTADRSAGLNGTIGLYSNAGSYQTRFKNAVGYTSSGSIGQAYNTSVAGVYSIQPFYNNLITGNGNVEYYLLVLECKR